MIDITQTTIDEILDEIKEQMTCNKFDIEDIEDCIKLGFKRGYYEGIHDTLNIGGKK